MKPLTKQSTSNQVSKPTDLSGLLEAFDRRHLQKYPGSRDMRYRRARRFVEWCQNVGLEMNQITGWEVETYLDQLDHLKGSKAGEPLAINTIRGHGQVINTLLAWADDYDILKAPKFKVPKAPKEKVRYLTDDQISLLIALAENPVPNSQYHKRLAPYNPRNLAFVRFCLETGARQSDALGLNWGDLKWNEKEGDGSAYVRNGKGGKSRMMYFGRIAWDALQDYATCYHVRQGKDDPVFCSIRACWKLYYEGKPLPRWTSGGIASVFNRFSDALGFKVGPHMLRHSWAVGLTKAGIPPRVLQKMGGWANLKMVERYTAIDQPKPLHKRGFYSRAN